jgi:hypothetical protein
VAEKFDVPSRLAEGRPAVDDVATYVWACHTLGYANPDLTLHASQVRDWYGTEDGLDLRALDADCAALEAAVAATEEALMQQEEGVGALVAAWQGASANLSRAFLGRHGDASVAAAAAVRTAAEALAALRDNLWHTVDGKVAAAIAIDDRAPDEWLAAAQTVTTGSGDRAAASERIDQEVKPFVANDIGTEWLTAMRSATAGVIELYDAATAELTAEPEVTFDVPGDLGPSWTPPPREVEAATVPAGATAASPAPGWGSTAVPAPGAWDAPSTWSSAPASAPPPAPAQPPAAELPTPASLPDAGMTSPAMAAPPSAPSLGGIPDVGSGLSGLGQQLADVFGGLLGSADDALADTPELDEPDLDDGSDDELDDDELDDSDDEDEPLDPESQDVPGDSEADQEKGVAAETAVPEGNCEPVETPGGQADEPPPPVEPAPTPVPAESAAPEPAPLAEPIEPADPAANETPCEIAADELPQVGE